MNQKKESLLPLYLAGILLLVGVVCYAAAADTPKEPVRVMFECVAGKVLFTHQTHTADYEISCGDCHHHPEETEESLGCMECHVMPEGGNFPQACSSQACHGEEGDAGEIEMEVGDMMKKADALHKQCIDCHKENDAGPQECASCHVKYNF